MRCLPRNMQAQHMRRMLMRSYIQACISLSRWRGPFTASHRHISFSRLHQLNPTTHILMAGPKAPRRKKHRNSKLGCATCKRRRVKCLEDLPECSNCAKHHSHCEYLDYSQEQLEAFRRSKLEQQKLNNPSLIAPHLPGPEDQLELLSLGAGSVPHMISPTTIHNPRTSEFCEVSLRGSHLSEHSRLPSRQLSFPSLAEGGLTSSHSDLNMKFSINTPVNNVSLKELDPSVYWHQNPVWQAQPRENAPGNFMNVKLGPAPLGTLSSNTVDLNQESEGFTASSSFTLGFDNLLATQGQEIIYPVYSSNVMPPFEFDTAAQSAHESSAVFVSEPLRLVLLLRGSKALPNAVRLRQTFRANNLPSITEVDYRARLFGVMLKLGPSISQGLASLEQIRGLYHLWLCFLLESGYTLKVMFLCLVNLTTNYLISNVFSNWDRERLNAYFQERNFRDTLMTHLIKHYAVGIRELRCLLNQDKEQRIAATVSYILSLMSMYDPEATINSTICFRDGMFSVLAHSLSKATDTLTLPRNVALTHTQLVGNISRTIYFPAYDPTFLLEFEHMLLCLRGFLSRVLLAVTDARTFDFILKTLEEFQHICHDTNTTYIPVANSNLHDLKRQTEVTFTLFHRWARFNPARLMATRRSTDPLEKLLNIFVILFRKAVYAVLPQGKFIYLRDLSSPLMLDVFNVFNDLEFYSCLADPSHVCIDRNLYQQSLVEIRTLAAYAIRVNRFMAARTQYLYSSLVYSERVRRLYPLNKNNMIEWRLSVKDIGAIRKEFKERVGIEETMIKSFNRTYISPQHYPRIVSDPSRANLLPEEPTPSNMLGESYVDLLSIDHRGLLLKDLSPPSLK